MVWAKKSAFVFYNFHKSSPSAAKILPGDAVGVPTIRVSASFGRKKALFLIEQQPIKKSEMSLQDRDKRAGLPREKQFPGGEIIQSQTQGYLPGQLGSGTIFGQHDQIIAIIQKGLSFISFWQGASPDMVDAGQRACVDAVSFQLETPAKIDLFHMRKKVSVETAQSMIKRRANKKGRATGPEYGPDLVILSLVFFAGIEYPSFGEGVPEMIDPPTCRSGILKKRPVGPAKYLRLAGADLRILFHQIQDGLYPSRDHFHIGIQQHIIIGIHLRQCPIISSGKTIIFVQHDDANGGIMPAQEIDRIVC